MHSGDTAKHWLKSSSDAELDFVLLVGEKVVRSWKLSSAEWQSEKSLHKSSKTQYKVFTVRVPFECKFINQEVSPQLLFQNVQVCLRVCHEQVIIYEASLLFT